MSLIVVGIDGGGTKTRIMVAEEDGREIVSVDAPASVVRPGAAEHSADVIAAGVRDALEACGMPHVVPKVLCAGIAGTGREAERQALWQALVAREVADEVVIQTDAAVALDDAFGDAAGILVIAGTGSMALGRSPAGRVSRAGGWGPVLGDEGSAAWIGRRALSAVCGAHDGREPETALTGAILTATECDSVEALIPWAATADRGTIAALAPTVASVADAGDLRANAILALAVEELVLHVRALARNLFVDERAAIPVAFTGGLIRRGRPLRKRLEQRLKTAVPGATVQSGEVVPQRGAVRGALRFLGLEMAGH